MPCSSIEKKIKGGTVYRTWKNFYAYDKKGRLEYSHYMEERKGEDVGKLSRDPKFWNMRYQYDKKDRLIKYKRLTEDNLMFQWDISYTKLPTATEVVIEGKQEPVSCLQGHNPPTLDSRTCGSPLEVKESVTFTIDKDNRMVAGKIESSWLNIISNTRLHFDYEYNSPFLGRITFMGLNFLVGQTDTRVGRSKEALYRVEYDAEDEFSLSRIVSDNYTTNFKSGEMCKP